MYPIIALAGPTGTGKTAIAIAAAKATGAIILPLDQLQRYQYLREGVGFNENAFGGVDHRGYQVLSPWEVSGPARYAEWLRSTVQIEARDRPVLIEGGCTSYLTRILELHGSDPIFRHVECVALNAPADAKVALSKIETLYDMEKILRIIREVEDLERRGFVSEAGLSFLEECEDLFVHPEHEDRNLAWAIRISAKVYCPAYLALKGRIEVHNARKRIVRNIRAIQIYQQQRVAALLPWNRRTPSERPMQAVMRLVSGLQGREAPGK